VSSTDSDTPVALPLNRSAPERVALTSLAEELGCRKQTLFKIAKRLSIQTTKARDADRGNQLIALVTVEEAERIRLELFSGKRTTSADTGFDAVLLDVGLFYAIQLEPDHDPCRIKVGFTVDLAERLRKHRCSAPFAKYLNNWPCRRAWERTAIDCVTAGFEQLHTEVFRATSVDEVSLRADRFFAVMPSVMVAPDNETDV
jgi:hypothetical protein